MLKSQSPGKRVNGHCTEVMDWRRAPIWGMSPDTTRRRKD
ncbi:hypothetical protein SynBIOSE41_01913 [Synechococcus sp. BIOS-E4-1]|nr:hypothetical protein SynBIOSE41_01913 [Synechococcus sp. BIOS-E4-1]